MDREHIKFPSLTSSILNHDFIMARFYKGVNSKGLAEGVISVNSWNYYPTTLVAIPTHPGTVLDRALLNQYDLFSAEQTASANDILSLPNGVPIGTKIGIITKDAMEISAEGIEKINNQAAPKEVVMGANELGVFTKTLNGWICTHFSIAGAVTAPVPD